MLKGLRSVLRSLAVGAVFASAAGTGIAGPMDVGGKLAVSESGAATYTIPIQVPPGTAGIEPTLALSYNSRTGNGLLGVGWSLSGLSAITRCPRTLAQDGLNSGVHYDTHDRLCLDGERLILIAGTEWSQGAEYRTERDSFSKVTLHKPGTDDDYFIVKTKAGQTLEYGRTADSQIEAQGKTLDRVWAINKISDTKGNYLTFSYDEDTPNGEYRPLRIDYTGNALKSLPTNASVQFVYEGPA